MVLGEATGAKAGLAATEPMRAAARVMEKRILVDEVFFLEKLERFEFQKW